MQRPEAASAFFICGVCACALRQQFFGVVYHFFGYGANRFQEVWHLLGIDLRHALAGIEEGGVAQVGKAVAHFQIGCKGRLAYAGIIAFAGTLGAGAALVVGECVDHFGGIAGAYAATAFGVEAVEHFYEVVVGEPCVFQGIVKPCSRKNRFHILFRQRQQVGETQGIVCREAKMIGIGQIAAVILIHSGVGGRRLAGNGFNVSFVALIDLKNG